MCGVSGIYERGEKAVDRSMLLTMRDRLVHRGPDDSGEHVSDHIGLSLNRLAVIDLSPRAHQPMANEDGTVVVAFNGEIRLVRDQDAPGTTRSRITFTLLERFSLPRRQGRIH